MFWNTWCKRSTWIFAQMLQNALNADQVYLNSANLMTLFSSQIQEPSFESKLWGGVKSIGVTKVILQDFSHFFLGLWIIKSFCREVNSHISGNIRKHCHISGNSENFSTNFVSHTFVGSGIVISNDCSGCKNGRIGNPRAFLKSSYKNLQLTFYGPWA